MGVRSQADRTHCCHSSRVRAPLGYRTPRFRRSSCATATRQTRLLPLNYTSVDGLPHGSVACAGSNRPVKPQHQASPSMPIPHGPTREESGASLLPASALRAFFSGRRRAGAHHHSDLAYMLEHHRSSEQKSGLSATACSHIVRVSNESGRARWQEAGPGVRWARQSAESPFCPKTTVETSHSIGRFGLPACACRRSLSSAARAAPSAG